jgi:hypothetical protein
MSNSSSSRDRAMTANYPESRAFTELLTDAEEDRVLRAALEGTPGGTEVPLGHRTQADGRW